MKKIGIKTLICLLFLVCPLYATSYYDDFQVYTSVSDPAFTLNYSLFNSSTANIIQAPADSLTIQLNASRTDYLTINESKLNLSYPFTFSITLRKGSYLSSIPVKPKISFMFFTNATKDGDFTDSRGYRINYYTDTNLTELRRCTSNILNPSCGVVLNSSSINITQDGFTNVLGTFYNLSSDLIFSISMDSTKRIRFYTNSIEKLTYYDNAETYLSGGITFGQTGENPYIYANYWDNILIGETGSVISPIQYENNGYSIYANENDRYNKLSWYDQTKTAYDVSYNDTTGVLNTSNLIKWAHFKILKDGTPVTYAQGRELIKNITVFIQANTHYCSNFFKPSNFSDDFYTFLGFDPTDPTAIPIYSYPIFSYLIPDVTDYDLPDYDSETSDGIFYISSYASMICTQKTLITNIILINDNVSKVYYAFKIYTGIGMTTAEIEAIVPDADGEVSAIPHSQISGYLIGTDIDIAEGTSIEDDPEVIVNMLLQPSSIIFLVMLALAGLLGAVGGMLMGGIGVVSGMLFMVMLGLLPAWIGFTIIAIAGLGLAFFIKSGISGG